MKLLDYEDYTNTPVPGFSLDLLKFKKRSIFQVTVDRMIDTKIPSLSIHLGPCALFELTLGVIKYYVSFNLWSKHYDY